MFNVVNVDKLKTYFNDWSKKIENRDIENGTEIKLENEQDLKPVIEELMSEFYKDIKQVYDQDKENKYKNFKNALATSFGEGKAEEGKEKIQESTFLENIVIPLCDKVVLFDNLTSNKNLSTPLTQVSVRTYGTNGNSNNPKQEDSASKKLQIFFANRCADKSKIVKVAGGVISTILSEGTFVGLALKASLPVNIYALCLVLAVPAFLSGYGLVDCCITPPCRSR